MQNTHSRAQHRQATIRLASL